MIYIPSLLFHSLPKRSSQRKRVSKRDSYFISLTVNEVWQSCPSINNDVHLCSSPSVNHRHTRNLLHSLLEGSDFETANLTAQKSQKRKRPNYMTNHTAINESQSAGSSFLHRARTNLHSRVSSTVHTGNINTQPNTFPIRPRSSSIDDDIRAVCRSLSMTTGGGGDDDESDSIFGKLATSTPCNCKSTVLSYCVDGVLR